MAHIQHGEINVVDIGDIVELEHERPVSTLECRSF